MRRLWRVLADHRDYRQLVSAGLISLSGDWILRVGLAYAVFALTGSTVASGLLLMASVLPQVLLGSVAGVFVDRWDHRHTMVAANVIMAAGLLPLLAVDSVGRVPIVYAVAIFQSSVATFFAPAESALVPRLVGDEDLLSANALNGQNSDLARLIGSAIGGVLAGTGGISVLAIVDAGSFAASAVLLALMTPTTRTARVASEEVGSRAGVGHEWRAGLQVVGRVPELKLLFVVAAVGSVGEGIMGTLFAPFVRDVLHGSGSEYGAIVSVQAVGGVAGGLVAAGIGHRFAPRKLLGWGAVAFGVLDLALFLYPLAFRSGDRPVWPAFAFMILVGLPGAVTLAGLMTMFQTATTHGERGRVFGAAATVEGLAMLVGIGLGGWLGSAVGIVPVISAQGGGYVLTGALVLIWSRSRRRAGRLEVAGGHRLPASSAS